MRGGTMHSMHAVPYPTPAGIDAMPLKVAISAASPLLGGIWDTSSCDTDNEPLVSEAGSLGGPASEVMAEPLPAQPNGRTPLRSVAAPYLPPGPGEEPRAPPARTGATADGHPRRPPAQKHEATVQKERTTVMMCNVPICHTNQTLLELLDSVGLLKEVDFLYVPMNLRDMCSIGYAFVNLTSHARAKEVMLAFEGFNGWSSALTTDPCKMCWSTCDGLEANIKRNQNNPIMGESVPAVCKPVLLKDGMQIPFPKPVKELRGVRMRFRKVPTTQCTE